MPLYNFNCPCKTMRLYKTYCQAIAYAYLYYQSIHLLLNKSSNGLAILTNCFLLTCKYRSVVLISKCPSKSLMYHTLILIQQSHLSPRHICLRSVVTNSIINWGRYYIVKIGNMNIVNSLKFSKTYYN